LIIICYSSREESTNIWTVIWYACFEIFCFSLYCCNWLSSCVGPIDFLNKLGNGVEDIAWNIWGFISWNFMQIRFLSIVFYIQLQVLCWLCWQFRATLVMWTNLLNFLTWLECVIGNFGQYKILMLVQNFVEHVLECLLKLYSFMQTTL
jgi:hypothetical protein